MKTSCLFTCLFLGLTGSLPAWTDSPALAQRERLHAEVMLQQREQISVLERQLDRKSVV